MKFNELLLVLILFFIIQELLQYSEQFYKSDTVIMDLHNKLQVLDTKLKKIRVFSGDRSYTLNKKRVYLCAKDENGEYYPENMLVYVLCHEYAHVLCDRIDEDEHSDEFYAIFNKLLIKAQRLGLYDPSIPTIDNYCGT